MRPTRNGSSVLSETKTQLGACTGWSLLHGCQGAIRKHFCSHRRLRIPTSNVLPTTGSAYYDNCGWGIRLLIFGVCDLPTPPASVTTASAGCWALRQRRDRDAGPGRLTAPTTSTTSMAI